MTGFSDKKILGITSAACVVILLLAWIVFFRQAKDIRRVSENYQKEKLNSFVLQEKRNKLSQLKKEISNLEEKNSELHAIYIKKEEVLPFLKILESIAADTNCTIAVNPVDISKIKFEKAKKTEKPAPEKVEEKEAQEDEQEEDKTAGEKQSQPAEKKDDLAELKKHPAFTIDAIGSFPAIVAFLNKMENIPYFARVLILNAAAYDAKEKKQVGGGSLATAGAGQAVSEQPVSPVIGEKNVKMTLTVVIYAQ